MKLILTLWFILKMGYSSFSQLPRQDSCKTIGNIEHCNIPKNKIWGNSWYYSSGLNLYSMKDVDFCFGRSNVKVFFGHVGGYVRARSYGIGVSFIENGRSTNFGVKSFWEWSFYNFPLIPLGLRGDLIYNISQNSLYPRFSIGGSLIFADVMYSFTPGTKMKIPRDDGLTIRLKLLSGYKKWETSSVVD